MESSLRIRPVSLSAFGTATYRGGGTTVIRACPRLSKSASYLRVVMWTFLQTRTSIHNWGVWRDAGQRPFATAYLSPEVTQRRDLCVACGTRVTRLLLDRLDSKDPAVIGIGFQTSRGGDGIQVHTRREVILYGGRYTLSGIGPAHDLERLGIPLVQESDAPWKNLPCCGCKHLPRYCIVYMVEGQRDRFGEYCGHKLASPDAVAASLGEIEPPFMLPTKEYKIFREDT
ncbi:Glucose dehydrogenase, partial [Tolypocladium capitatum]